QQSEHPLAAAIVRAAEGRGLPPAFALDFRATPGKGAAGRVGKARVVVGTAALLSEQGIDAARLAGAGRRRPAAGAAGVLAGRGRGRTARRPGSSPSRPP